MKSLVATIAFALVCFQVQGADPNLLETFDNLKTSKYGKFFTESKINFRDILGDTFLPPLPATGEKVLMVDRIRAATQALNEDTSKNPANQQINQRKLEALLLFYQNW